MSLHFRLGDVPATFRGRGFSLVELMVSIALGLVLMVGVVTVVSNTNRSFGEVTKTSQQLENGRFALQSLRDDIRNAGFFGQFSGADVPAALPNPCVFTLENLAESMAVPVLGFDNTAPACLPGYRVGTDVIAIRRSATRDPVTLANLVGTEVYVQTRPRRALVLFGDDPDAFTLLGRDDLAAPVWPYRYEFYYIRNCSLCDGDGDGIPTLYRAMLSNGALVFNPVAEGIESMHFRYGIDDDENGSPDRYLHASHAELSGDPERWASVVSVEVNLLARALQPSPDFTDTKEYDLGEDDLFAPGGPFKRHVFKSIVRVTNLSSRRES